MVTPNISYNIAGLQATTCGNETRLIRRKTKEKKDAVYAIATSVEQGEGIGGLWKKKYTNIYFFDTQGKYLRTNKHCTDADGSNYKIFDETTKKWVKQS